MTRMTYFLMSLIALWFTLGSEPNVSADVTPGDVIDKSNWKKVEGLLPEPILNWLKRGDLSMQIAGLNYDPKDYLPPAVKKSMVENAGKYEIDDRGVIVDAKTGDLPDFIEGLPFPDIKIGDPQAGAKAMFNRIFYTYSLGPIRYTFFTRWVGPRTGFDREIGSVYRQYPMVGDSAAREIPNPKKIQRYSLILTFRPFDVSGANMLSWRYLDTAEDMTFTYIPAIRRVRRMSPTGRSDQLMGSDLSVDDAWGFDGKINTMEWKLLRKEDVIVPFLAEDPQGLEKNRKGAWQTTDSIKRIVYGYEKEGWQGAPWIPTNLVWVKRPAYVIEVTPKDRYYNYGTHYMWLDAEVNVIAPWKIINDRAGAYWKTVWHSFSAFESADREMRFITSTTLQGLDERREHATVVVLPTPDTPYEHFTEQDLNDFTLAGFQKLCK